jgi:hypothetical protein
MRTISYSQLEKRIQTAAGLTSLDTTDRFFIQNSVNHRLREAWDFAPWPELTELRQEKVGEVATDVDIGPDLADQFCSSQHTPDHWYDASDSSTITQDNGKVSGLADKVGAYDLSVTTEEFKPTVLEGDCGLNGNTALRFDGFDDRLLYLDDGPLRGDNIYIFTSFELHDLRYGSLYLQPSKGDYDDEFIVAHAPWRAGELAYQFGMGGQYIGVSQNAIFAKDTPYVMQISSSLRDDYTHARLNSSEIARVEGTRGFTGNDIVNFQLGGRQHSNSALDPYDDFFLGMKFGEMMIFTRYLSLEDQQIIEAYLSRKWGIKEKQVIGSKGTNELRHEVLNVFDKNPLNERTSREVNFTLLNSRLLLNDDYKGDSVWMLAKKEFTSVSSKSSVPAIFESFLVSAVLADFYRGDGRQDFAQVEENRANESLLRELDKVERLSQQNKIPIRTYQPILNPSNQARL